MDVKVVDASALAALLFGESEAGTVAERLSGCILTAPALLPFEVASVCLKKIRLRPGQRRSIEEAFERMRDMGIVEAEVDMGQVVALAEKRDLTVYDASYLWLARRLDAELVTLDHKLLGALIH
jgi:predicted nucleic acid-binding protein